ncbi:MAG TPA: FAD-dependent oxidoreductase [Pirellulales bacterium]|jgi:sulfide:quinone oxidoreductase|nr:FAD-dependent oxidoreductase [Pirellulales bacterium]
MTAKPKIVVLGGGFGGLEAAFYLRHKLGDRAEMSLVTDQPYFLFKPNTIYIPFGADPERFKIGLDRPTQRKNIRLVQSRVQEITPQNKTILAGDQKINYDYLVVATGAAMRPDEIPGLKEHALTLWTPEEMLRLRDALQQTVAKARENQRQRVVFLVPPNNKCSGPLYELVMMTDTWLREQKCRDAIDLIWATKEDSYIQAFGPRLNTVVTQEFEERNVTGHKGFVVTSIEPDQVNFQNGERLGYDLLVSFPPYIAGNRYPSLPSDDRGFIKVAPDSRRVKGFEEVFTVGDAADFPIKQAFLALLQADAAADHLAAEILGVKPQVDFEPMSMCVMEEFNRATFAQVPLKYTGDLQNPVEVETEDAEHYKVGVSPLWRLGKKVLGIYLPWRFGHGEPFHAGFAWDAMDLGLKVMARVLAR